MCVENLTRSLNTRLYIRRTFITMRTNYLSFCLLDKKANMTFTNDTFLQLYSTSPSIDLVEQDLCINILICGRQRDGNISQTENGRPPLICHCVRTWDALMRCFVCVSFALGKGSSSTHDLSAGHRVQLLLL